MLLKIRARSFKFLWPMAPFRFLNTFPRCLVSFSSAFLKFQWSVLEISCSIMCLSLTQWNPESEFLHNFDFNSDDDTRVFSCSSCVWLMHALASWASPFTWRAALGSWILLKATSWRLWRPGLRTTSPLSSPSWSSSRTSWSCRRSHWRPSCRGMTSMSSVRRVCLRHSCAGWGPSRKNAILYWPGCFHMCDCHCWNLRTLWKKWSRMNWFDDATRLFLCCKRPAHITSPAVRSVRREDQRCVVTSDIRKVNL